ncbi:6-phosphofructokinase [symbiont of Argiope bruennichi]|uniref:6-phosphofructokinase n=1 Tax=symbiont of Argiope bruennichi TaxID=2810479 RepID=UPI003DA2ECCD
MNTKKIAILTSGGDAPGMNACIRSIVRTALKLDYECYFIYQGYYGLVNNNIKKATSFDVSGIINKGGTILGASRLKEFTSPLIRKKGIENLKNLGINNLIVIGGDGTYRGAEKLSEEGINCIAIPGTIDNNINGTEYTIGFDTCMNTIVDSIDKIRDTSSSHNRCAIIETMGQFSGNLALYSALVTGAELVSIPEAKKTEEEIIQATLNSKSSHKNHCIIVVSEHLYDVFALANKVTEKTNITTRASVLGYIQRGGAPSFYDRKMAALFGEEAIFALEKNYSGVCVCLCKGEIVLKKISDALAEKNQNIDKILEKINYLS